MESFSPDANAENVGDDPKRPHYRAIDATADACQRIRKLVDADCHWRVLDASTCWEIVTDPEDIEQVYYYHFQWPCVGPTHVFQD